MQEVVRMPGTLPNVIAAICVAIYLATSAIILWSLAHNQIGQVPPLQRSRYLAASIAAPVSLVTSGYLAWSFGPVQIFQFLASDDNGLDTLLQVIVFGAMGLGLLTSLSLPFVLWFIRTHPAWAHHRTKHGSYIRTADWLETAKIGNCDERRAARQRLMIYNWDMSPGRTFTVLHLPASWLYMR